MRHILSEIDFANTATELSKQVDIMDVTGWLWLSWWGITANTTAKCFAQCSSVEDEGDDAVAVTDLLDHPGDDSEQLVMCRGKHTSPWMMRPSWRMLLMMTGRRRLSPRQEENHQRRRMSQRLILSSPQSTLCYERHRRFCNGMCE